MSTVSTTWDWFSSVPLAHSAGTTISGWYEGAKNRCVLNYALSTVEATMKVAASAAQPVVKRFDEKIAAADTYAVEKLKGLEDKYPYIKKPTEDVMNESKDAMNAAWKAGAERVAALPGSGVVSSTYNTGKGIVSSGSACVKATYDGTVRRIGDGYSGGKAKLSSGYCSGKDYVVSSVKASSEYMAETRVAKLVGSGVTHVLTKTDSVVDYMLPEEEEEDDEATEEGEKEAEDEKTSADPPTPEAAGNVECARKISRKLRKRMHRRAMARVETATQYYKELLDMLKAHTELLKLAQTVKDAPVKGYHTAEGYLKQLLAKCEKTGTGVEEDSLDWLKERSGKFSTQSVMDAAKDVAGRVVSAAQSVAKAVSYLPQGLRDGASKAVQQATSLLETVRKADAPRDLPRSTLASISDMIDTQKDYLNRLGRYVSDTITNYLYPTKDESTEAPLESEGTAAAGSTVPPPSNDNSNTDTPLSERPVVEEDDEVLLSESDDEESDDNDDEEGFGDPTGDNSS